MDNRDRQAAINADTKARYDAHARPLRPLEMGQPVRIQNPQTKAWDRVGVIVSIGHKRDYRVEIASGGVLWRNHRFLRPYRVAEGSSDVAQTTPTHENKPPGTSLTPDDPISTTAATANPTGIPNPRRSQRQRIRPKRFND